MPSRFKNRLGRTRSLLNDQALKSTFLIVSRRSAAVEHLSHGVSLAMRPIVSPPHHGTRHPWGGRYLQVKQRTAPIQGIGVVMSV